ncbi:MAG: MaoC family dehydratase N-terminal domain-containing protein [Elusimicrobiota bacterium]
MPHEIPQALRALIGKTRSRTRTVTPEHIRRFAQAIGESDDVKAPPLFCQSFIFEDVPLASLPPDGSPIELDAPIPASRAVGGSSSFEFPGDIRAGDILRIESTLRDAYVKEGKGGLLYFLVIETSFVNQEGKLVAKESATYIKR